MLLLILFVYDPRRSGNSPRQSLETLMQVQLPLKFFEDSLSTLAMCDVAISCKLKTWSCISGISRRIAAFARHRCWFYSFGALGSVDELSNRTKWKSSTRSHEEAGRDACSIATSRMKATSPCTSPIRVTGTNNTRCFSLCKIKIQKTTPHSNKQN